MGVATDADQRRYEVERWRADELLRAGYPPHIASEIAVRLDIDLHLAVDLVVNGCDPRVAAEILL